MFTYLSKLNSKLIHFWKKYNQWTNGGWDDIVDSLLMDTPKLQLFLQSNYLWEKPEQQQKNSSKTEDIKKEAQWDD